MNALWRSLGRFIVMVRVMVMVMVIVMVRVGWKLLMRV